MAQTQTVPPASIAAIQGATSHGGAHANQFWALTLGAVGVVYGDIGTSPLYAFSQAAKAATAEGTAVTPETVFGVLSLMIWSLFFVVTLKYVVFLLSADNKGEGGTFALMSLVQSSLTGRASSFVLTLGIMGASLFFGDAIITPAISVLSAVEGLKGINPAFGQFVVPLTVAILLTLFLVQSRGTAMVGAWFGPVMLVWFVAIGAAGVHEMLKVPGIMQAFNPLHGIQFLRHNGLIGFTALGLVCLTITGAEALYADLGHFGARPIQFAWLFIAFPALLLNYLGQGALLLAHPDAIDDTFFKMFPDTTFAKIAVVLLATAATVIASQAVITGAYSLTRQAIQLGLLPRCVIQHTSAQFAGQIYLPRVNALLLIGVLVVVLAFRSSDSLAAAYGVAVTGTLMLTSINAYFVFTRIWKWPLWRAAALAGLFITIEVAFFAANLVKIVEGGWMPLLIGLVLGTIMFTWVRGSVVLSVISRKSEAELGWLVNQLEKKPPFKVPGTAVFLTGNPNSVPTALMHNLKHNKVLHERNVILSIRTEDVPRVNRDDRVEITKVSDSFTSVIAHYGFMETPNVPEILDNCKLKGLSIEPSQTSFFLSRRALISSSTSELPHWQETLFLSLAATADDASAYFRIPSDRVVEVGTQIAI